MQTSYVQETICIKSKERMQQNTKSFYLVLVILADLFPITLSDKALLQVRSDEDEVVGEATGVYAQGRTASIEWGWLIELPPNAGCQPHKQKHKQERIISLMKRGQCTFVEQARNSGTKVSVIYNYQKEIFQMPGFGELVFLIINEKYLDERKFVKLCISFLHSFVKFSAWTKYLLIS